MTTPREQLDAFMVFMKELNNAQLAELKHEVTTMLADRIRGLSATGALSEEEQLFLNKGDLMGCVRSIRDRTGLGLRDAKEYMDRARGKMDWR